MISSLEWETDFFSIPCAEYDCQEPFMDDECTSYEWVQAKCKISDRKIIYDLEENGFHFEDLRLTYHKQIAQNPDMGMEEVQYRFRLAGDEDLPALKQLAQTSLPEYSRFTTVVGLEKTGEFYVKWTENALLGTFDDGCFILEKEREMIGFVTYKKTSEHAALVGLISIAERFRNSGSASVMMRMLENRLSDDRYSDLHVVTEGKNIPAQRFYIKNGFNITDIECWYYWKR